MDVTPEQAAQAAVRDEIRQLLAAHIWKLPRGGFTRGALSRIVLLPGERTAHGDFNTALVAQAIAVDSTALAGFPLALHAHHGAGVTYYGRLDSRGALRLGPLPAGDYSIRLPAFTHKHEARLTPPLRLERLAAPAAAGAEHAPEHQFVSSGLQITTTVRSAQRSVELYLESHDAALDGALVGVSWRSEAGANSSGLNHGLLLAPLAWSDTLGVYVAHLRLDVPAIDLQLCLPETLWPLITLTDEMADVVRESLRCIGKLHTRRAWQRLRAQAELTPSIRAVLDEFT